MAVQFGLWAAALTPVVGGLALLALALTPLIGLVSGIVSFSLAIGGLSFSLGILGTVLTGGLLVGLGFLAVAFWNAEENAGSASAASLDFSNQTAALNVNIALVKDGTMSQSDALLAMQANMDIAREKTAKLSAEIDKQRGFWATLTASLKGYSKALFGVDPNNMDVMKTKTPAHLREAFLRVGRIQRQQTEGRKFLKSRGKELGPKKDPFEILKRQMPGLTDADISQLRVLMTPKLQSNDLDAEAYQRDMNEQQRKEFVEMNTSWEDRPPIILNQTLDNCVKIDGKETARSVQRVRTEIDERTGARAGPFAVRTRVEQGHVSTSVT